MKQASNKSLDAVVRWMRSWVSVPIDLSFTIDGERLERELMTPGLRSLEPGSELR